MSLNDPLSNALSHILNCERRGISECIIRPTSKLLLEVLNVFKESGYITDYKKENDARGGVIKVNLLGKINKCGAIKPRFSITKETFEKFERRYLPSKDFGILIISTSKGIMTNNQAKEKKVGGKLISYVY